MATLWKQAFAVLLGIAAAISGRDVCSDEKGGCTGGVLPSSSTNSKSHTSGWSLIQSRVLQRNAAGVDMQEASTPDAGLDGQGGDTPLSDLDDLDIDPAMEGLTDPGSDIDPAMAGFTDIDPAMEGFTDTDPHIDPAMAGFTDPDIDPAMPSDPAMANAIDEGPSMASAEILLESGNQCRDDPTEFHCADMALRGQCVSNRAHMAAKCPRSCCECTDQVGTIYGIGMNYNIYKQPKCSPTHNKGWTHIGRGEVKDIQLHTRKDGGSTSQPYLYGIGVNNRVWKQPLCGMTPQTHWSLSSRGDVTQIVIHKDDLYGIGLNNRVWKQPLRHMTPGSHWHCVSPGFVRFIHIDSNTDILYGIGMGGNVYRQNLRGMSVHTPWQHTAKPYVTFIVTHDGWMYGIGGNGAIHKQRLSTMSPSSPWTQASRGAVHQIEISGQSVYGIGMGNNIWRQSLSTMSAHSHWTHATHGDVSRILTDSHCGEKPPVGRWKFLQSSSAGQSLKKTLTVQTTNSESTTLTQEESNTFGIAISLEVNFVPGPAGGLGGSVGTEVSHSTTSTISESYSSSFSHSQSWTDEATCEAKPGKCPKLWQWMVEDENRGYVAFTARFLCTYGCRAHSPECPVEHCNSNSNEMCSADGCVPWGVST